jgi:hypothetical protein
MLHEPNPPRIKHAAPPIGPPSSGQDRDVSSETGLGALSGRSLPFPGYFPVTAIIPTARRFRTQERNRQDAYERLIDLIYRAAEPEKRRIPTRPTAASRERRREAKLARGRTKRQRRPVEQPVE